MRTKILLLIMLSTAIFLFSCGKDDTPSDVSDDKEASNVIESEEQEDKNNIDKLIDGEDIETTDNEPIEGPADADPVVVEDEEAKEETPQEEQAIEETPKEQPIEEQPKEVKPKEEAPKEEKPQVETPKEQPKEEQPKEEAPKEKTPKEKTPKEETPKEETPKEDPPKEEAPKEEAPKEQAPKEEAPTEEPIEEPPTEEKPQEVEEENLVKKTVIMDGYDLTEAVNGKSLKNAYKDYFMIGVGLNGYNIQTDTLHSAAMSEIIKYQFNSVTYSNLMKPSYMLDQNASIRNYDNGIDQPAVNFSSSIKGLEFCKENNIQMRGHTLVWHNQVPEWFFKEGYQSNGAFVDRDTMLERLESFIKQVLTFTQVKYPGVIYCWDVVNEAVEIVPGSFESKSGFNIRTKHGNNQENLWYKVIGVDYVEKSFEYARKYADKDVKLFYNDYNTFQPDKTAKIYELASYLKSKDLIDGIGMQGYMSLGYPGLKSGGHNVKTAITKFAQLGLEIQITELSISSDDNRMASMEKQAKRYQELFEILADMDTANGNSANITSVTVFGLMDEYMLYENDKNYSRLFDKKLQPKPSFYSILSVAENLAK